MSITEFLTARYDEDEAIARSATPGPWATQTMAPALVYGDPSEGMFVAQTAVESAVSERALDDALYIEHFHPARVLADIAAKRAIVALHRPVDYTAIGMDSPNACVICGADLGMGDWEWAKDSYPCQTVRLLTQPYVEHADFDPAWRV